MNALDRVRFVLLFSNLAEAYHKKLSDTQLDFYWRLLRHYDYDRIEKAIEKLALNPDRGQYLPTPADIASVIEGNYKTRALRAWSQVQKAIRRFGAYESVSFDDGLIHVVLQDMGGWIRLCRSSEREHSFQMNEFVTRYCGYLQQDVKPHYPTKLIGSFEQHNSSHGLPVASPQLVCDADTALTSLPIDAADTPQLTKPP